MPRSVPRGFTLLEVLLAMAIFAVVSVMVFSGLNNAQIIAERMREQSAQLTGLERAYRRLQADFESLYPRPVRDELGTRQPALVGGGLGQIELTRGGWRNPAGLQRSSLQRVAYALDGEQLTRVHWVVLDRVQGSEPVQTRLLDGVNAMRLRYLEKSQRQWLEFWPPPGSSDPELLPLAVELSLDTAAWGTITWLFRAPG